MPSRLVPPAGAPGFVARFLSSGSSSGTFRTDARVDVGGYCGGARRVPGRSCSCWWAPAGTSVAALGLVVSRPVNCHAHNSMCAVMTASTPTSSTEGERGQGYGRGACVRVCCGPNAGMSLIYYHLRGWWCSGSVMWCCCCRSATGSNRLRCASLFWNSCRLKVVAARGGGPLRLRGTWHGLGRYSLVPCTTGCLARPGAMPGH